MKYDSGSIYLAVEFFEMMNFKHKTKFVSKQDAEKARKHFLVDASGKTLGRLASEIANILRGKHKTDFTPNIDTGDGVVVINVEKLVVSGNKEAQKSYFRYTGYIGGLRETPYRVMKDKNPEYILQHAVKGMLPKTKLGRAQFKKLHLFRGESHNMKAQKPIAVNT